VPIASAIAVSVLVRPVLGHFRHVIFVLPSICLFVGGSVAAVKTRTLAAVSLAALIIGSAWQTWFALERLPRFNFRVPAIYVLSHAEPGDALAVRLGPERMALDYYFAQMAMPNGLVKAAYPDWTPDTYVDGRYMTDAAEQEYMAKHLLAQIDSTAASGHRLWFVAVTANRWDGHSIGGPPFPSSSSDYRLTISLCREYGRRVLR
jgi:hypothetical protein